MQTINIVIIDSGVSMLHPAVSRHCVQGFSYSKGVVSNDFNDSYGHGTAVFNIVNTETKHIPTNIINVKLTDIENEINEDELIGVLNYLLDNYQIDIINLSLGICVCQKYRELLEVCKKLRECGTILVSAFDNSGTISYPAAFKEVVGVVSSDRCRKNDDYVYINDSIVNIAGKGNIQKVAWTSPDYIFLGGNSIACAHATAVIAKLMYNHGSQTELFSQIKKNSLFEFNLNVEQNSNVSIFKINKAAAFPFNKEMHSIVRYSNLLNFELVDIYDVKYSMRVGASTNHLMNVENCHNWIIKSISDIAWDSFDTLILGHTDEMIDYIGNDEILVYLTTEAVLRGKNIYSFDNIDRYVNKENDERYFHPKVQEEDLPPNRWGMLYKSSKPILGVFGTSSRQGKFTLQLTIRSELQKMGYNVGQIGTEPSALLFGMDYVYPMGYNSSVYIKEYDCIRYLNHLINNMCIADKDIIIVGSQSGTVPYDDGNIAQYNNAQFNFLMGTNPDAVVLCINPFDAFEYIERTIRFLQSSVNCEVIAIVVFPINIQMNEGRIVYGKSQPLSEEEWLTLKAKLSDSFGVPIFKLLDRCDMTELMSVILDFFQ